MSSTRTLTLRLRLTLLVVVVVLACLSPTHAAQKKRDPKAKPKAKANAVSKYSPFWLQDPKDGMCLGPKGFTFCDVDSLWVWVPRGSSYSIVSLLSPNPFESCLVRKFSWLPWSSEAAVSAFKCNHKGAMSWDIQEIAKDYYRLAQNKNKMCLARAKGSTKYSNAISMLRCDKGYTPLKLEMVTIHTTGFFLQAADGKCFDGQRFRSCDAGNSNLLWTIGINFKWNGVATRHLVRYQDSQSCLISHKGKLSFGSCNSAGAKKWGLKSSKLTQSDGKMCLARLRDDTAVMVNCNVASEYIQMASPKMQVDEYAEYSQYTDPERELARAYKDFEQQRTQYSSPTQRRRA